MKQIRTGIDFAEGIVALDRLDLVLEHVDLSLHPPFLLARDGFRSLAVSLALGRPFLRRLGALDLAQLDFELGVLDVRVRQGGQLSSLLLLVVFFSSGFAILGRRSVGRVERLFDLFAVSEDARAQCGFLLGGSSGDGARTDRRRRGR